jgi:hypothetical protein
MRITRTLQRQSETKFSAIVHAKECKVFSISNKTRIFALIIYQIKS